MPGPRPEAAQGTQDAGLGSVKIEPRSMAGAGKSAKDPLRTTSS
jgi:hypothetical protein